MLTKLSPLRRVQAIFNRNDLLGLTASGTIVFQWIMTVTNVNSTQGPVIPENTWTHVAVVYQTANGIRLYINGQFSASSSNTGGLSFYELGSAPSPWYMTLGNNSPLGPEMQNLPLK